MTTTTEPTPKPESNLARDAREMAEAQARHRAEMAKSPQFAAMAKAVMATKEESAALDAAQARVTEAEEAVGAASVALSRARSGMDTSPGYDKSRPFTFFLKSPNAYKAAQAAMPGLRADLEEARLRHATALRLYNALAAEASAARLERRRVAKVAHAPQAAPHESRDAGWHSMDAMARWTGTDAS